MLLYIFMIWEIIEKFNTLITLLTFILIASGVYWKTKAEINIIKMEIEDIKKDRQIKWMQNEREQIKQYNLLENLTKSFAEISVNVQDIRTNVEWLKKKQ